MAGMRGEAPAVEHKKNEWVDDSNALETATRDPVFAKLLESVTDDSDMARLVRSHNGTFDSADLFHLQESAAAEQAHERRKLQTERAAFGALRAREAEREADERAQRLVRAAAAAAATISAAGSKPRAQPSVMVKRAAAQPVPAEDQQRKRAHAAPQCAALAGLAAYSDSEEDS